MRKLSGRRCSRASCTSTAIKTLTYIYSDSTAVLGPLSTYAEPHNYDLCAVHSQRLTVPVGWSVIKEEIINIVNGNLRKSILLLQNIKYINVPITIDNVYDIYKYITFEIFKNYITGSNIQSSYPELYPDNKTLQRLFKYQDNINSNLLSHKKLRKLEEHIDIDGV